MVHVYWSEPLTLDQRVVGKAVRRNFFLGGGGGARLSTIFEVKRKRGCGRGVSPPPPTRGSFCIFEIEIERSGAHFGWILGGGGNFE